MGERGAPAAYRGYRLQALYALNRMLSPDMDSGIVFHPEGLEDLDMERKNGVVVETVQVKSHKDLALSYLSPEKELSFFRRALRSLQEQNPPIVKLINFGPIGIELQSAWLEEGRHRNRVFQKLSQHGYSDAEIQLLFNRVELSELEEEDVKDRVFGLLRDQVVGVDPEMAFDLMNYWLYRQAENRARITTSDLILRIQEIGRFLSERYHHHQEWFTSIQPIEDLQIDDDRLPKLREEFFAGVSARYEHILAGLDFRRDGKLEEISQAFDHSKIVIVHAASGQGKTALVVCKE